MKLIKLTQGKFAQVDDEDFEYLNKWKWSAMKNRKMFYAIRGIYAGQYPNGKSKTKTIFMHKEMMNPPDGLCVDHKDRDGLNMQRKNMRLATNSQNQMNKSGWGLSKYKGVAFHRKGNKWMSYIQFNKKRTFIGLFKSEVNAATAYNIFAEKYHGEFANYNKA